MLKNEIKKIPTRNLECPKCLNSRLYIKYLGQYRNMTLDELKKC